MTQTNFVESFSKTVNDLADKYVEQSIELGNIKMYQDKLNNALSHYQEAQRVLVMLGKENEVISGKVIFHIGDAFQRQGNQSRAKQQYELAFNTLGRLGALRALSEWMAGYLSEQGSDYFIQGKALNPDELALADKLLPMFMYSADSLLRGKGKSGIAYYLASNPEAMAEVELHLEDDQTDFDGFLEMKEGLTRIINSLEISEKDGTRGIHVDDLYMKWYEAAQRSELTFK